MDEKLHDEAHLDITSKMCGWGHRRAHGQRPWPVTALVPNRHVAWNWSLEHRENLRQVTLPIQIRCSDLAGEGKASQPWNVRRAKDERTKNSPMHHRRRTMARRGGEGVLWGVDGQGRGTKGGRTRGNGIDAVLVSYPRKGRTVFRTEISRGARSHLASPERSSQVKQLGRQVFNVQLSLAPINQQRTVQLIIATVTVRQSVEQRFL
jgi:hypothetical protein